MDKRRTELEPLVEAWLVFSWEHNAFWAPDRCGYTRFIERAGRYSKDEAETICRNADYRTEVERKRADDSTPPSEICFPSPDAIEGLLLKIEGLRTKLEIAATIFEEYGRLHRNKGTAEGDQKAARNEAYAAEMRDEQPQ